MALILNAHLSKERQLAVYTANVYMGTHDGRQIRGFVQAAQSYLGKPVSMITEQEFIRLVAMIKGPNMYHPVKHPALLEQRSARVAALVTGKCQPAGWLDTTLERCDP